MISDEVRRFIEARGVATVASVDAGGHPHLAPGSTLKALDAEHLLFENWFCPTTLRNVEQNPRVAVAVTMQDSFTGYQLLGTVVHGFDVAFLSDDRPGRQALDDFQALTRLVVRVEEVLAFCSGIHSDLPLED